MFRYREQHLPGPLGWLFGVGALVLSLSLGSLLNLIAQVADHAQRLSDHKTGR
jgi:hypothetical protein